MPPSRFTRRIQSSVEPGVYSRLKELRTDLEDDCGYKLTIAEAIRYIVYNHFSICGTPTDEIRN